MSLFLCGACWAQTAGQHIDVTHYDIHLWDFDFSGQTLQGEAFVSFTVTESTNTIVLELKTLTVTDVACDYYGVEDFSQSGDFLTIVFDEPITVGESAILDIRYGGNTFNESWGGVHWWGERVYNLGVGFDSQPHNLGKAWFPCVDDFTDKASYDLFITATNDKKALCGGNLVSTFDNGDGTTTWHWNTPQEVATYHISFTVGDYVLWEDVYHGIERDIPIEVYALPNMTNAVPGSFVHIHEIAAFQEATLGPYPFNRIGYVTTSLGCMEHTDNIALATSVVNGNTDNEEYLAHELSHMWSGNLVTCATAADMWLNEGFAQFWGTFYRSGIYGEDDFRQAMSTKTNTITGWCLAEANWIPLNDIPLDMTYDSKAVYDRGAVVVNTMMNYLGRETFLEGMRHYFDLYAYGDATSEQLRDALTESTGVDMNGFFDTYVFHAGMPHYDVSILDVVPNGSRYDARLRMSYEHIGPSHVGQDNRVEVTFFAADGQSCSEFVGWDGVEAEVLVTLDFAPVAAFVDYNNQYLDAKYDKNVTAHNPTSFTFNNLQTVVESVTDSVLLRTEAHLVGPDYDPVVGLTLSTHHYWNVLRLDCDEASVSGYFTYSNASSVDGDIIHTQNDSAVLVYRSNPLEAWHTIPYTQEGNWKIGRFHVDELMTGQYTIAAIDKTIFGVSETLDTQPVLFPNPASDQVSFRWNDPSDGTVKVYNPQLQLVKSIPYHQANQLNFSVSEFAKGLYFVEHDGIILKLIIK